MYKEWELLVHFNHEVFEYSYVMFKHMRRHFIQFLPSDSVVSLIKGQEILNLILTFSF